MTDKQSWRARLLAKRNAKAAERANRQRDKTAARIAAARGPDGTITVGVGIRTISFDGKAVTLVTGPTGETVIPVNRIAAVHRNLSEVKITTVDGHSHKFRTSMQFDKLRALAEAVIAAQAGEPGV